MNGIASPLWLLLPQPMVCHIVQREWNILQISTPVRLGQQPSDCSIDKKQCRCCTPSTDLRYWSIALRSVDRAAIGRSRINRPIVNLPFRTPAAQPTYLHYRIHLAFECGKSVGIKIDVLEQSKCAQVCVMSVCWLLITITSAASRLCIHIICFRNSDGFFSWFCNVCMVLTFFGYKCCDVVFYYVLPIFQFL